MSKNLSNESNDFINLVDDLIIDLVDNLPDDFNDDLDEELNDELKPCPFCGYRAYIDYCNYDHSYAVTCSNCCIDTGRFIDKEACIKAWNNRPIEDKKDNQIKELTDDLAFSKKWAK